MLDSVMDIFGGIQKYSSGPRICPPKGNKEEEEEKRDAAGN